MSLFPIGEFILNTKWLLTIGFSKSFHADVHVTPQMAAYYENC